MFDPAPVAIPCTIIAIIYMTLVAKFLLPKATLTTGINAKDGVMPRIFYSTFKIVPGMPLVGASVAFSGLKQARDMTLLTVLRNGNQHAPAEDLILLAGDMYAIFLNPLLFFSVVVILSLITNFPSSLSLTACCSVACPRALLKCAARRHWRW